MAVRSTPRLNFFKTWAAAMLAIVAGGCATTGAPSGVKADMAGIATGFLTKTMDVNGTPRPYVVYVPREYDPEKPWPLVVFLHGRGERGDDGLQQSDVGIGHAIRKNPERFPCIVVMPQCPDTAYWNKFNDDITMSITETMRDYNIDEDRVLLTGLSMGGYGTWVYGADHIETFAALMPICGGGRPADGPKLANIPIWAFHGDADETVNISESQKMIDAVKKAGGKPKFTVYKGVGHNSWDDAYGDPKAISWLLSQRR